MTLEQKPFEGMFSMQKNKMYQKEFLAFQSGVGVGTVLWPVIYCHVSIAFFGQNI